jgi:hypothetical protein
MGETYREQVVVVAYATVRIFFFSVRGVKILVCGFRLLCGLTLRERFVLSIAKFLNKYLFPLLENYKLSIDDFLYESRLILQFSIVGMVDAQPMFLETC